MTTPGPIDGHAREPTGWRRVIDVDGPWPWLIYLPMYAIPWAWDGPDATDLAAAAIGFLVFVPLYFVGSRAVGRVRLVCAIAIVALAFALAPFGGNWTVVAIYASAMAGELRPRRIAAAAIGGFALATIAFALALEQPWLFWLLGAFMSIMVGAGTMSSAALRDKNAMLLAAQEEVRALSRTAERERIARDLHDLLGRTLTLVAIKAELAAKLAPDDPTAATREMREVAEAARVGLADVRAAVAGTAGASLAREIDASRTALAAAGIALDVTGAPDAVPAESGAVLAMALREAVTNVIRHAGARACRIEIEASDAGTRLVVTDDGGGGSFREGAGLSGMRARLKAAGGMLALDRGPGRTRLVAALPVASA